MKYSVKLIIRHTAESGEVFLEESILFGKGRLKVHQRTAQQGVSCQHSS